MIQRIQSIWLLLAAVCAIVSFKVSFYFGLKAGAPANEPLNATSGILLILCTAATFLASGIAIFLFSNRKIQLRVSLLALVFSVLSLVLYLTAIKNYSNGQFTLTSIVSILIPVFILLAMRGIWKDQKLVKSLDRLR